MRLFDSDVKLFAAKKTLFVFGQHQTAPGRTAVHKGECDRHDDSDSHARGPVRPEATRPSRQCRWRTCLAACSRSLPARGHSYAGSTLVRGRSGSDGPDPVAATRMRRGWAGLARRKQSLHARRDHPTMPWLPHGVSASCTALSWDRPRREHTTPRGTRGRDRPAPASRSRRSGCPPGPARERGGKRQTPHQLSGPHGARTAVRSASSSSHDRLRQSGARAKNPGLASGNKAALHAHSCPPPAMTQGP